MSVIQHKREAIPYVKTMVITVSDTRNKETDKSGQTMIEYLKQAGHEVILYQIVKDDEKAIRDAIILGCQSDRVDVILLNGGTGIATRDVTVETVKNLLDKEMPGFGEIFRLLSYQEDIGAAAMLSRAIAGVVKGKVVFATPGSTGAVKLAMNKLIIPEITHAVREVNKDRKKD